MRSYATIPPSVWQTDVKKLRGNLEAIAVYYYLTTCSHSTMIGIYPLPVAFISYEIGLPLEGAWKGLRSVCEADIATYDEEMEIVWVHEMAVSQVAPRLAPKDNKVTGVAKQLAMLPICQISLDFYGFYRDRFHFRDQVCLEEFERAFQGASEPLRSKEQEQEQYKDQKQDPGKGSGSVRFEAERLTSTREDERENPYDQPLSLADGRSFLQSIGCPPNHVESAMQRLMRGCLFPCDIENWKLEAKGYAA